MLGKQEANTSRRVITMVSAGLLVVAVGTPLVGVATAQAAEPTGEAVADEINLEAFSQAYTGVEHVRQRYKPAIEQAESRQQKRQLMHQAHRDMREVIEQEGLTVEEYSRASVAVSENPELKGDVRALLDANQ